MNDPRVELLNRIDAAVIVMDFVSAAALARLNYQLIDNELLQFAANRVAQLQPAARDRTAELRQKVADARYNHVVGQAAIAIGDRPSQYMVNTSSSAYQAQAANQQQFQLAQLVQQMLTRAAVLQGRPDPEVAPALAARASDVLNNRLSLQQIIQLVLDVTPPDQRGMILASAQTPLAAQLFPPLVRGSAVWAVSLEELAALAPELAIVPRVAPPPPPVAAQPPNAFTATLVETLLAQAMAADAAHADALYIAALDAAEKTPSVNDDIVVLQQIIKANGSHAPSEVVVRRMAALLAHVAPTVGARDDLARIISFVVGAAFADKVETAVGEQLVVAARAMLNGGLETHVDVALSLRTADLCAALGKPADALTVLANVQARTTDQKLLGFIEESRGRLQPAPQPMNVPPRSGLVPPAVRAALGNSLLWEDQRGDFVRALAAAKDDVLAQACVLVISGQARAATRLLAPLLQAGDRPAQEMLLLSHVYRYAQRVDLQYVVGGAPYLDVYLRKAQPSLTALSKLPDDATARADVEAILAFTRVLPNRHTISIAGARYEEELLDTLKGLLSEVDDNARTQVPSAARSPAWLPLAAADLHRRGNYDSVQTFIDLARTAAAKEPHALGEIALAEGHWAVCSVESPLTLGLCLEGSDNSDSSLDDRLEQREYEAVTDQEAANGTAHYDRAEAAFRDAKSPRGLAMVMLARAGVAALTRDHGTAVALARQAEQGFAAAGDELGRRLARTHVAIALTAKGAPADRDGIREIGTWCQTDGSLAFGIGCARLLSRSGRRALYLEGNIERAIALHRLAYELLSATSCDLLAAQALVDEANAFRLANDLDSVADTLERASVQLGKAKDAGSADLAIRRAWFVQQRWALENQRGSAAGLDRVAMDMPKVIASLDAAQAVEATEQLLPTKLALIDVARMSPVVSSLCQARDFEADPDKSPEERERACQTTIALARNLDPSSALLFEGRALAVHGDNQGGSAAFRKLYDAPDATQALLEAVGSPLAKTKKIYRLREALSAFLRVRDIERARSTYDQLVAVDPKWAALDNQPWSGLADAAAVLAAEGDRKGALALFEQAISAVEDRRSLLSEDSLKRGFVDTSPIHAMYVGAARACTDDPPRAFAFVERGRARALLDLAMDRRAASTPWRAYNAQRDRLYSLLATERAKATPAPLRIAELENELAKLVQPAAPERRLEDPRAVLATLDQVVAKLPEDTVLLEYAFADDYLIAWAISRTGMKSIQSTPLRTNLLRRAALGFRNACAVGSDTTEAGATLAKLLLEPFAESIRAAKHVVIVPSDSLHVVPFHALPFDNRQLIDAVAVSYAPSASLALELGRGAIDRGALLAIGNPADMAFTDDGGIHALAQLPGAAAEVKRIVGAYPNARGLIGEQATLAAVTEALPAVKVVHLATHGIASETSPWLSTIALAHRQGLDLATLQGSKLDADLVTLSACDTARGTIGRNDEVIGFARGLIAAGARRAITSLWTVSDNSTCELMAKFYAELAAGRPVAQALRAAQIHVRDLPDDQVQALANAVETDIVRDLKGTRSAPTTKYAKPKFWAPFMLIGL